MWLLSPQRSHWCFVCPRSKKRPLCKYIVVISCLLGCQLTPDGCGHRHERWREVIRHHLGELTVGISGAGGGRRTAAAAAGGGGGSASRPLLWIMQPSVRSAHCPPLDSLVSSVTITHLPFTPALTPNLLPSAELPPPTRKKTTQ